MATKSKRETTEKRNSILDAAIQAFVKYGYDNTSMDRIAEIANASKRTVYNHFSSKDDLFNAVLDKFDKHLKEFKEISYDPDADIKDQLSAVIDSETSLIKNENMVGLKKVLISKFIHEPDLSRQMLAKYGSGQEHLEKWLINADRDGKLKVKDPATAAEIFSAIISGAFTWPFLFIGQMPTKAYKKLKDEIIEIILSRYGTE